MRVKEPGAPIHLGVDDKSAGRGKNYVTIVSERGSVEYIADERRQASLDGYLELHRRPAK